MSPSTQEPYSIAGCAATSDTRLAQTIINSEAMTIVMAGQSRSIVAAPGELIDWQLAAAVDQIRQKFSFDFVPGVFFFDDTGAENAYAFEGSIQGADLTIIFGRGFLNRLLANSSGAGVHAVLAHESAHLWQYRHRATDQLPKTGSVERRTRRFELQADFAAGWYLGGRPDFDLIQVQTAAKEIYNQGRASLGFADPTHGLPTERYTVFLEGFLLGRNQRPPVADAMAMGAQRAAEIVT